MSVAKTGFRRIPRVEKGNDAQILENRFSVARNSGVVRPDTATTTHVIKLRSIPPNNNFGKLTIVVTPTDSTAETDQKTEEPTMNTNAEQRASRIMEDVEALRSTDPSLFLNIAKEISRQAESISATMLGENHPLASLLSTPFTDPAFDRIIANVDEYRKRQNETGD
jgi:hypothetical protein